ncbi:MAG: ribosome small subunit-dependent GTPase A [Bacteroidota bacterium]
MTLDALGWNRFFAEAFQPFVGEGHEPARVAVPRRKHFLLYSAGGEVRGKITGRMLYQAAGPEDLPAVGDWVVIQRWPDREEVSILDLLPRKSEFVRKVAGRRTDQQVVAANSDIVFLVSALDQRLTLRGLERYLVVAAESGATPVVLLNKADLCDEVEEILEEVRTATRDVPVHVISAKLGEGMEAIRSYMTEGVTGTMLGPSGAGKSTIINTLLGSDYLRTREVRDVDDRGRHVTTQRELVVLPEGGLLIDTPGMRELQLFAGQEGIAATFDDVEELGTRCQFRDCQHEVEPGCAVLRAIAEGGLDVGRFESYKKLLREAAHQKRKVSNVDERKHKEHWKKITAKYRRENRQR